MKLQNRKTGEIGTLEVVAPRRGVADEAIVFDEIGGDILGRASSIAELNAEWEDYEEPKEYYTIDWTCTGVTTNKYSGDDIDDFNKSIGNYFKTREEAEKAVEKLKAWKRLKDAGFKLKGWYMPKNVLNIEIDGGFSDDVSLCDIMDDLDKVLEGEE